MIRVTGLRKRFGDLLAVDGIAFEAARGEVVGFLGPNGAGKTTTLRILAAYLPASEGSVVVAGHDVGADPLGARRCLGYLPESAPLYLDLRVIEYLDFRARLRELPRGPRRAAIDRAIERCGLGDVRGRVIGTLSKGYRQRVGLADAILASPPVLLLDEPTAGLDPAQAREIRALVRELGRAQTVLLSTHLLAEVEAMCDRAIILARGRIAADGRLDELGGEERLRVVVRGDLAVVEAALARLAAVRDVERVADSVEPTLRVRPIAGQDAREAVVREVAASGALLLEIARERRSLEQVFLEAIARPEAA